MSFSKRFSGPATALIAAIGAFPAEQRRHDEPSYGADGGVTLGHEKQIKAAIAEITPVIQAAAAAVPDAELSVSIWGHANADQSGSYNWELRPAFYRPTPLE